MTSRDSFNVKVEVKVKSLYQALFVLTIIFHFKGVENRTVSTSGSDTTVVASEDDLDLKCTVSGLATNESAQSLKWSHTGSDIITYSVGGTPSPVTPWTSASFGSDHLTVKLPKASVTKERAGSYICTVVTTGSSAGTSTAAVSVTVQYPPSLAITGSPNIKEGSTLSLTCNSNAVPAAAATWKKNSSPVGSGKSLTINNISRTDAGVYTCSASNTVDSSSETITVGVYHLDKPTMDNYSKIVKENASVTVTCSVLSMPPATLTISGPGTSKQSTGNKFQSTFTAGCGNTGQYQCIARNSQYSSPEQVDFNISVLCSPRKDTTVDEETEFYRNLTQFAVFKATLVSNPAPDVKWKRKVSDTGEIMKIQNEAGHFEITTSDKVSTLNVTLKTADDFAKYTLEAVNSQGRTTLDYFLRAQTKPYIVTTLEVVNKTTDSITVRWSSSFNGGAEQRYVIEYRPENEDESWLQRIIRIDDPGRKKNVYAKISDIHPDRTYRIRVFSENVFGRSSYSNELKVTTEAEIPFGIGIVVGLVICLVIVAGVIGAIVFYVKRIRNSKKNTSESPYENQVFRRGTLDSQGGHYSGLDGTRERPAMYDDLHKNDNNVYQNVSMKDKEETTAESQEKVYMNFTKQKSEEVYETPM